MVCVTLSLNLIFNFNFNIQNVGCFLPGVDWKVVCHTCTPSLLHDSAIYDPLFLLDFA